MSIPAILQVEKKSTLADYVKNTFVLPSTGGRAAAKEAAVLLADANPHLGAEKDVNPGAFLMVPPDFPLALRKGIAPTRLAGLINALPTLKRALTTILAEDEHEVDAIRNEHETTAGLLDLATTIEAGRERIEQIEHIRAAADEKLRRQERFREARRARIEQLDASLQELADFLGAAR